MAALGGRWGRLAPVCAVAALGLVLTAGDEVAVAQPTASPAVVVLRTVAFEPGAAPVGKESPDAALIGKVLGTSTEGGAGWQNRQDAMATYSAELQAAAGRRIVGAFVPRGAAAYAVVIRVSGSEPVPALEDLAARVARKTGVPLTVEYVNTPTLRAMLAAARRFGPGIRSAQDGVGDIGPDEATSEIAIAVTDGVGDPVLVRAQAAATFGAAGSRSGSTSPARIGGSSRKERRSLESRKIIAGSVPPALWSRPGRTARARGRSCRRRAAGGPTGRGSVPGPSGRT